MSIDSPFEDDNSKMETAQSSNSADVIAQNFSGINYAALPFHHLISAKDLSQKPQLREAGLSNKNLECRFFEQNESGNSTELIWEAKHFDESEGCGEIYRAEMLTLKRAIYELGDNLPKIIEIKKEDLQKYLNVEAFRNISNESAEELFFDNLTAPFKLTLNSKNQNNETNNSDKSESLDWFSIFESSRVKEWDKLMEKEVFQIILSPYWQDWQRLARKAKFDFELIEKLSDSRAIRFYEVAKLLCAIQRENLEDEPFCKLEIDYEKFVMLLPLPKLLSVEEVENQIKNIIVLLEEFEFVKRFSIKSKPDHTNLYNMEFQIRLS